jgi:class 3 adenylate cyclase/YHS domain-containing protein
MVRYLNRRFQREAVRESIALRLVETPDVPGQIAVALAFVDLASFTPLTEAMGDVRSADVLDRFASVVRRAVARAGGRVVKQIGDAFMLAFLDPGSAVACALAVEAEAAAEPQFPAVRAGVHWGPVLYREGDYVGANVNVAARVAAEADRHQVLVTAAVRDAVATRPDIELIAVPARRLKGIADAVALFEVRAAGASRPSRPVDPVCGMELGPGDVAARLAVGGTEHAFCSDACLRKFAAAPRRYRGATRPRAHR